MNKILIGFYLSHLDFFYPKNHAHINAYYLVLEFLYRGILCVCLLKLSDSRRPA